MASKASTFLTEMKRRKVFQVAVVYIVVGLGILAAAESILDPLGLENARPFIVILTLLGFPIALVLAWAYEVRPENAPPAKAPEIEGDPASVRIAPTETDVADASKSIVVLPFVNMSSDQENEYFSDGMTEEIINALTQLSDLHVVARTSSFAFKGKTTSINEISQRLNVTTVLEGSVRKVGNRLRITAQLINAADGFHLWSEKYDREADDVFAIQDEISLAIVDKLKVKLIPEEKTRLVGKTTLNPVAHEAYLKGRYFWNQREAGLEKAIEFFRLALTKDSNHGLAYAGLADAYSLLGFYGYLPPKEVMPKAKEAARRALEINDNIAEAHASLGYVHTIFDWEWEKARKEFQRALELNPSYGPARLWYCVWLWAMGRFEEAIAEVRIGLQHDPLSVTMRTHLGIGLVNAQQYAEASEQLVQALELDPDFINALSSLGMAYYLQSRVDDSFRELQKAIEVSGRDQWPVGSIGAVHAATGDRKQAEEILVELEGRAQNEYIAATWIAGIYALLDETDKAIQWVEKACEERDPFIALFHTGVAPMNWAFKSLEAEPRFQDMLRRFGLRE